MSKRIRYVSERTDTNFSLVSQRVFTVNGTDYRVYLYPSDAQFQIKNAVTGEVVSSGTGVSESNLKIKAKRALTQLGVTFDSESRDRGLSDQELSA